MGYLSELNTIIKTAANAKDAYGKMQHKSIARGALDGTLQFPCLISNTLSVEMATTIAKTLERVYASFVQTYFSLNNTIDISVDKNPNMFLQKFHHNVKVESTGLDLYKEYCIESDKDYDALMERIYDGTTKAYINGKENKMILFNFSEKFSKKAFEDNQVLLEETLAHVDYAPFPNVGNSPFYEADIEDEPDYYTKKAIDARFGDASSRKNEIFKVTTSDKLKVPVLTDNDVKKSNDLQPYLMQVRLMAVNDQKEFVQFMDFIVGIKVVLHTVKSEEMITNLQAAMQNGNVLFNFIRCTTGEKSFFKDFLLGLNDTKLDVANRARGSSPWWATLKRLKNTSRAQSSFFSKTQLVPNSTIVVSAYEVDMLKNNYGMDLRNPKLALAVMKSLFLMNFVIIDEGSRSVEILYDGETSYQIYPLETLEREISMNSNKLGRELTRMISR